MAKVFDGTDFDIHELEEPLEVKIARGKEHINAKLKRDLREAIRSAKPAKKRKSLIVALASNIVLPGLGSVYIKRTFLGISILALNIIFLVLGLSFLNLLTHSFLYMPYITPQYYSLDPTMGAVMYDFYIEYGPSVELLGGKFNILLTLSVLSIIGAWIHLAYHAFKHKEEFEFMA